MFIKIATCFGKKKFASNRIVIGLFKKKIKMLYIVHHNKGKGKGKFYRRTVHVTHRGSRGIALLFL
jgi:hypothetical protein